MLAAGAGSRFGAVLKQYEKLGGRRLLDWSIAAARSVSDGVVLVVPPDRAADPEEGVDAVVAGGATRSASVRAGLAAVPSGADVVVVHDAARPMASPALFSAVVGAVRAGAVAAIPGVPIGDTVKRVGDGVVVETLDRSQLVAAQTPQAFRADVLRRAHDVSGETDSAEADSAEADPAEAGPVATDDAALVEQLGEDVVVIPGESGNVKITHVEDLTRARMLLPWTFSTSAAAPSAGDAEVS